MQFFYRPQLILALLVAGLSHANPQAADTIALDQPIQSYGARADVQQFAYEMAQEYQLDYDALMSILAQATFKESIVKLMDRTPEGSWTWEKYRRHFLDSQRIKKGIEFWTQHRETLEQAESEYGVPVETIVAIIGIETRYGSVKGRTRILDALMTLGFDYPRRASYFRKELKHFILMYRQEGFDPYEIKGSYAGAMGWGQFMPSSYRTYAIDFDDDGVRDLLNNPIDAIGSVANYLARHGWRRDLMPAIRATLQREPAEGAINFNKRRPSYLLSEVADYLVPVNTQESYSADEKIIPLKLKMDEPPPQYWLGSYNLYVITRYNSSLLYAMAAHELGQTIKERYHNAQHAP